MNSEIADLTRLNVFGAVTGWKISDKVIASGLKIFGV